MKAYLMFRDRDFDLEHALPSNADDLIQDLELETLFGAMSLEDKFLHEVAKVAILTSVHNGVAEIGYRQRCMEDCLANEETVRAIYALSVEAIESEKKGYFGLYRVTPDSVMRRSVEVLSMFIGVLRRLRDVVDEEAPSFRSEGFGKMFSMLQRELDDGYFTEISSHLKRLKFADGMSVTARLGAGNKGMGYVLRETPIDDRIWPLNLLPRRVEGYTINLHPRDEAGAQALVELRDRGQSLAAAALGRSTDHILDFFRMLRVETGFYICGLNLRKKLAGLGQPYAIPEPATPAQPRLRCRGLVDVCLSLSMGKRVIGNDIAADGRQLIIVTGANQGGKSTFLRSVGLAQLMMQSGLFVGANSFAADTVNGVFTHYKRGEDDSMTSGKFDEELRRMDRLADVARPRSLFLFNESFASTNEREGSEVATQIVDALLEVDVKVVFVTHMYEFAHSFEKLGRSDTLFLRAERSSDGTRPFALVEGEPSDTGFGEDLYKRIFALHSPSAAEQQADVPENAETQPA